MKKLLLISIFSLTICLTACGNNAVVEETTTVETTESVAETLEETKEPESTVEPTVEATTEPTAEPTTEPIEEETTIEESTTTVPETVIETPNSEAEATDTSKSIPDTSNVNYALPYIVNGIDIRSGDTDGDGVSNNHQNTWYDGKTWTASNGIVLRIADGFDIQPGYANVYSVFTDGTENREPGSDFMIAFDEYTGRQSARISASDLPDIATPSSLLTSINKNDASLLAYKAGFDPLWQTQNNSTASELIVFGQGSGIGLLSTLGTAGYMWEMEYDSGNGYWVLELKSNYTELIWDSIRNSIRLVCPDGEAVYQEIYKQCYSDNPTFPEYDMWVNIGSTEVMASINGGCYFYFR